jgi:hypothetical protein
MPENVGVPTTQRALGVSSIGRLLRATRQQSDRRDERIRAKFTIAQVESGGSPIPEYEKSLFARGLPSRPRRDGSALLDSVDRAVVNIDPS